MTKNGKYLIYPFVIALMLTIIVELNNMIRHSIEFNFNESLLFFGGIIFMIYIFIAAVYIYKQIFADFFESSTRGKILILLISLTFIMKAAFEIILNK